MFWNSLYLIIGWLIAGAHWAWARPNLAPDGDFDVLSRPTKLGIFCVVLVGPFWPVYVCMMSGARMFNELIKEGQGDG